MATLKKSLLFENASGKVGQFVIKNFRGKKVLITRPSKIKISRTAKAVSARKNFAATVIISKAANSIPIIKEIWRSAKTEGSSPFQKLMSYNGQKVNKGQLTLSNIITPAGLYLKLNSVSFQNNKLNFDYSFPEAADQKFPLKMFACLYFQKYFRKVLTLENEIAEPSPDGNYIISVSLDVNFTRALNADPHPIIYLALAGAVAFKKKFYWTDTAAVQL